MNSKKENKVRIVDINILKKLLAAYQKKQI